MEKIQERRIENLRKSLFGKRPEYIKKTNLRKLHKMSKEEELLKKSPEHNKQVSQKRSYGSSKSSCSSKSISPFVKQTFLEGKNKDPGRVQVFVRIRPLNESEDINKHPSAVTIEEEDNTQLKVLDGKNDRCYQFDGILPAEANSKEVYKTVGEPLVYSALSGFNGILMCYGQTGTGKTYTLMSNDGMSVRVVYQCFKVINSDKNHKYTVTCSYLQIYQEKIYDLLNETRTIELSLREHPKTGVYIENLTEYVVHSPKEVLNLLKVGKSRLVFAETKMNRVSSRSHAICQLKILKERLGSDSSSNSSSPPCMYGMKTPDESIEEDYDLNDDPLNSSMNSSYQSLVDDEDDEDVLSKVTQLEDGVTSVRGKIYICDLAGSERIKKTKASGERLQEAQHINSSLLELGNVIQALAEGKNRCHVPFRNSTLTRLLQEGLSGNCKTRLVVCIAPTVKDVHETKCSLNFGSRAMKVQVTAHVNYEVDYKKLAEALAAKLETLESDWNLKKKDYEKFINQLKHEVGNRRLTSPLESSFMGGTRTPAKQVKSLLIVELMTLQLFYNLQVKLRTSPVEQQQNTLNFTTSNQDMMLQSMEGLLELLNDCIRDQTSFRSKNYSNLSTSSGTSSVITSPDYIDQNPATDYDLPSTLEPVSRFLEHAQITSSNQQCVDHKPYIEHENLATEERFKRVINTLVQLKEVVNQQTVKHLKDTFETSIQDTDKSLLKTSNLNEIVGILDSQKELLSNFDSLDDVQALENTLYYLQIDKALLSCMVLLKIQAGENIKDISVIDNPSSLSASPDNTEIKRIIADLTRERKIREKLKDELYTLQEQYSMSEEKLKDIELELQTVRELKNKLETKLHHIEDRNVELESEIKKLNDEKESVEKRLSEVEKKKIFLETSLKTSDNNNARKERVIVDLKNEKVALDSLVSTLKEEINILEKEKVRDSDERRHIEEELEDIRDRNIILETEWSCCREENGLLENELTALEEDKAILEDEIMKYREDVRMLEEAVTVLEAQASDYKQDILTLKTKEDRLLVNVRTEKEKFNKEMNELRQEMSTLRVEKRRFQRDINVSRADKANTERAYTSLKTQKDSLQGDVASFKQEEKKLQREIATLKTDRAKLEREVNALKNENHKLKQDLVVADKLKIDFKLLQKNEERIYSVFNFEKDKLLEQLTGFKEKFHRMESDYVKICQEKEKLIKQLRKFENAKDSHDSSIVRRSQSQPAKASTPDKGKMKPSASVQGALVRRSVHSGEVSEVEGKVLDLQRRLAFFMAEKEDIQKELITSRDRNSKLTCELKLLEEDTSKIQLLLSTLADEKESLENKLTKINENKEMLDRERDELKEAVKVAHEISCNLQKQLDELTEQNHILAVDHLTVRESVTVLQKETVLLKNENKHIKSEFEKVDLNLKTTKQTVENLTDKLGELKSQVKNANRKEIELQKMLDLLENENASLTDQVKICHDEEESLVSQLLELSLKVNLLENEVENDIKNEATSAMALEQVEELKEKNLNLENTISSLKMQLSTVVSEAQHLKDEREVIEKLLEDEVANNKNGNDNKTLLETIQEFKVQLLKVKEEKFEIEDKIALIQSQVTSLDQMNSSLQQNLGEKSSRLEQEKLNYTQHIENLQHQVQQLMKERMQLEAEVNFLKKQNAELRHEIAIILADNDTLEQELNQFQISYDEQENELESATEETKVLLRQLCAAETQNLNLCTMQSGHQDDVESYKQHIKKLQNEKAKMGEDKFFSEVQSTTLKERLIMAELEISQLKTEHATVESQRRLLIEDLEAADRERSLLKSELQGLARALSPLKKEVTEVVKRQESLQQEVNQNTESNLDISKELIRAKEDLSAFHVEKKSLESEQVELEDRLKMLGKEKDDVRSQLRYLIQDLDHRNSFSSKDNLSEMEESIHMLSELIAQKDDAKQEQYILTDDIDDCTYKNQILNIHVDTSHNALKSAQEDLCLATVDRLKLKDKARQIEKKVNDITEGEYSSRTGLTPLQLEVNRLKNDIENFESSQENLLLEVRSLNQQLNMADNNLENVLQFKVIIENNLKQYKERNTKLEAQLKIIYNDLIEMEAHSKAKKTHDNNNSNDVIESSNACKPQRNTSIPPTKGAKLLLETLDLHKHFQLLEDDLKSTEVKQRNLKEDAADLLERCSALEEEKEMNSVSKGYIHDSITGQNECVSRLQKEKETLAYEKQRLQTKLTLHKNDKKRMLEDFQRLNKNLSAYIRYNQDLEKKLLSFKVDFSDLENKSELLYQPKQHIPCTSEGVTSNNTSQLLCSNCQDKISRKFLGVHKNTQLLGDELLDCITDNMSLEAAILSFMEDKSKLEQELVAMEMNQRELENLLSPQGSNNRNSTMLNWSGSSFSIDSDLSKT